MERWKNKSLDRRIWALDNMLAVSKSNSFHTGKGSNSRISTFPHVSEVYPLSKKTDASELIFVCKYQVSCVYLSKFLWAEDLVQGW